ncbi:DUF2062 domain-containing protein [Aliagarivorans taiwanensis]|uniref:DUF2062 domain-containing protein n=1 Tax=Aliagarivorans taiwanensis TaxID=561966 RepID=UPI000479A784|nr:DUF2062 domain-containing protein [Aliagarivorans taiwanensis]
MPKRTIQRFIPKTEELRQHKHLKFLGDWLHSPSIWHLNRRSAAGGFALGIFVAFVPIPMQMILAAMLAIALKVNLPLSVAMVWISNPITWPAMFYGCYWVGTKLLGQATLDYRFHVSIEGLRSLLTALGPAFLLGSLVCGVVFAIIGYVFMTNLWRASVRRRYLRRRSKVNPE